MTENKIPPHPEWSPQEKWVWEKICNGEEADFNKGNEHGGEFLPNKDSFWNDENENAKKRVLRSRFLETILTDETYKNALTRRGVRIIGAWFREVVDLTNADIKHELWLVKSRFDYDVYFNSLKTSNLISLQGSTFKGKVSMDNLHVDSYLVMDDGAVFEGEVILLGSKVGAQLSMTGATFKGKVNMDSVEVDGSLFMRAAEIQTISIPAVFEGEVILRAAKVGGQLDMKGSTFKGNLNMESLQVGSHLFMRNATFETGKEIGLLVSHIGGSLDISGSKEIPSLDLTGTTIKGEFYLGSKIHPPSEFQEGATLTLRNTEIGALQDLEKSWEGLKLELTGFTYKRLGGIAAGEKGGMAKRDANWMEGWLAKQDHYSPQPYEQLAKVLRESGHKDKADRILYASKEREFEEERKNNGKRNKRINAEWGFPKKLIVPGWRWWKLFLLKITIGYGFKILRIFWWIGGFTIAGGVLLALFGGGEKNVTPYYFAYSLNMLLPLIKLSYLPSDHVFQSFILRWYFVIHQLAGWALASVLIAGLTGITKK